jgi:hypothetical protein
MGVSLTKLLMKGRPGDKLGFVRRDPVKKLGEPAEMSSATAECARANEPDPGNRAPRSESRSGFSPMNKKGWIDRYVSGHTHCATPVYKTHIILANLPSKFRSHGDRGHRIGQFRDRHAWQQKLPPHHAFTLVRYRLG